MNVLILMLVSLVIAADATSDQFPENSTANQLVVVAGQAIDGVPSAASGNERAVEQVFHAKSGAHGEVDKLLFYLSSHAQAVSESTGPSPTSWLALRPTADVRQRLFFGASDPARPAASGAKKCAPAVDTVRLLGRSLLPTAASSSSRSWTY